MEGDTLKVNTAWQLMHTMGSTLNYINTTQEAAKGIIQKQNKRTWGLSIDTYQHKSKEIQDILFVNLTNLAQLRISNIFDCCLRDIPLYVNNSKIEGLLRVS